MDHFSDCAVHNAPAYEPGPCDCGADNVPDCLHIDGKRVMFFIGVDEFDEILDALLWMREHCENCEFIPGERLDEWDENSPYFTGTLKAQ